MAAKRIMINLGISLVFSLVFNYVMRPRLVMNVTRSMFAASCENKEPCLKKLNKDLNKCINKLVPRKITQCVVKLNTRVACKGAEDCVAAVDNYWDLCYNTSIPRQSSKPDESSYRILMSCINKNAGQNIFVAGDVEERL